MRAQNIKLFHWMLSLKGSTRAFSDLFRAIDFVLFSTVFIPFILFRLSFIFPAFCAVVHRPSYVSRKTNRTNSELNQIKNLNEKHLVKEIGFEPMNFEISKRDYEDSLYNFTIIEISYASHRIFLRTETN